MVSSTISPEIVARRYELVERLGAGSMGEVYQAIDLLSGKPVALKRIRRVKGDQQGGLPSITLRQGLAREFRLLASLRHPNVISVLDYGFDAANQPYFTMELLDHPQTILEASRSQPIEVQIDLLIQVLQAMAYLHWRGIIHRDLKPSNILVTDGKVKVLDFGLANDQEPERGIAGTVPYMAPEALRGNPATRSTDLYSIGVIAYEILVGSSPFDFPLHGLTLSDLIIKLLVAAPDLGHIPLWTSTSRADANLLPMPPTVIDDVAGSDKTIRRPSETLAAAPDTATQASVSAGQVETQTASSEDPNRARISTGRDASDPSTQPARLLSGDRPTNTAASVESRVSLRSVVGKLLARESANRYDSATRVIEDFCTVAGREMPEEMAVFRHSYLEMARFVGRETELEQLLQALKSAMNSQGSVWLLGGESGVGKSRLLDELRIAALEMRVVTLRGQAVAGGESYAMWRDVLYHLAMTTDSPTQEPFWPRIEALLEQPGSTTFSPSQLAENREQLLNLIAALFRRQERPILLILEDLQWAAEGLIVLKRLSRMTATLPLLIIGSYRPDEYAQLPREIPGVQVLKLERFDRDRITRLTQEILGADRCHPRLLDLLERETEGNLLYLVEVLAWLAERAKRVENIGRMRLPTKIFPRGVQESLGCRLLRISPPSRPLLYSAAALGRQLNLDALHKINPDVDLDAWLFECANAAMLEQVEGRWRFAHDRLRDAVLDDIPRGMRRPIHRQAAIALEAASPEPTDYAAVLANLWKVAGDKNKERSWAELAGKRRVDNGAYREALPFLRRALTLHKPNADARTYQLKIISLRHQMAIAYDGLSNYKQSGKLYQDNLILAREVADQKAIANALNGLGVVTAWRLGKYGDAARYFEECLEIFRQIEDFPGESRALGNLGNIYCESGELERATTYLEEALEISRRIGDRPNEGIDLGNLGSAYFSRGEIAKAFTCYEQSLKIKAEFNDRRGQCATLRNLGALRHASGQIDPAIAAYEEAYQIARDIGNLDDQAIILNNLGAIYVEQGYLEKASINFKQALAIVRHIGERRLQIYVQSSLADVSSRMGDLAGAQDAYRDALRLCAKVHDQMVEIMILNEVGLIFAGVGDIARAVETLLKALALSRQSSAAYGECIVLGSLGNTYLAKKDYPQAIQTLLSAREIATRIDSVDQKVRQGIILAQVYLYQNQLPLALDEIRAACQHNIAEYNHDAAVLHGLLLSRLGQYRDALTAFNEANASADAMLERTANLYGPRYARALAAVGLTLLAEGGKRATLARNAYNAYVEARENCQGPGVLARAAALLAEFQPLDSDNMLARLYPILK